MIKRQLTRWLIVGLITNSMLYGAYLALTRSFLAPRTAMTVVYVVGVLVSFLGHRSWSFEYRGRADAALLRYVISYAFGYLLNLAGLVAGVELFAWPHEAVQGVMILVVALVMFSLQRRFVFPISRKAAGPAVKVDM